MILLVLGEDRTDAAMQRATVESILSMPPEVRHRLRVSVAPSSTEDDGSRQALESAGLLVDASYSEELAEDAWIGSVRAGTVFAPDALSALDDASRFPLQVFVEDGYRYRLNVSVTGVDTVSVDDLERVWVGSTVTLARLGLDREIRSEWGADAEEPHFYFSAALIRAGGFHVLRGATSPHVLEDRISGEHFLFETSWYLGFIDRWSRLLASQSGPLPYLQAIFLYLLQVRLRSNRDAQDKMVIQGDVRSQFFDAISAALQSVDDELLLSPPPRVGFMPRRFRIWLLELKYGGSLPVEVQQSESGPRAMLGSLILEECATLRARVEVMDLVGDVVRIEGSLPTMYNFSGLTLSARYGKYSSTLADQGRYSDLSVFGERISRNYTFSLTIPIDDLSAATRIELCVQTEHSEATTPVQIDYPRPMSKLGGSPKSYWAVGRRVILRPGEGFIGVQVYSALAHLRAEVAREVALIRTRRPGATRAALMRAAYFLTAPVLGKRTIWMYADRVVKGGDNGEFAYDGARAMQDDVKKYYVLDTSSSTAARFRKERKPFLAAGTFRQRLLFLHSDVVYATRVRPSRTFGFGRDEALFRDLLSYRVVYINHGLVVDRLDYVLNRTAENIARMCVVSSFERDNLLRTTYGFRDEEIVETGFARFDGLVPATQRRILLAPTWRSYLHQPQRGARASSKNNDFAQSEYFAVFNSLINNERLMSLLDRTGYELVYLLHPNTSSQIDDFSVSHPRVSVLAATDDVSYEELLRTSALMITDYSGVQFDFAFMGKPIVYYQPQSLPPHYEAATFDYRRDGFGEVVGEETELVDVLSNYLANDCVLRPAFQDRIRKFFTHLDRENARRVYAVGKELS